MCTVSLMRAMRPRTVLGAGRKSLPCRFSLSAGSTPCIATRRTRSASRRYRAPSLASQMRTAFSSMARKDRLKIAGRAADNLQHLGCSRLLLQRFGEFARALLLRLEQSRVLDGDDRLIGEGRRPARFACR